MGRFPQFNGESLSWDPGLYQTIAEERLGFPRMRVVIRAMMVERPEQLERERQDLVAGSFCRIFGHNARKGLAVLEEEISLARGRELALPENHVGEIVRAYDDRYILTLPRGEQKE